MSAEMDSLSTCSSLWEEIDLAEIYLLQCKFEDAASLTSSVIRLHDMASETLDDSEFLDIMDSAGVVFVQSLKELGKTSEIFKELVVLFGSVPAIPAEVFLTGASAQISSGLGTTLRPIFELFLNAWTFVDGQQRVLLNPQKCQSSLGSGSDHPSLSVEDYFKVTDIYVVQILGMALHDVELAISWTKDAELPAEKRQELLRTLQSLCVIKNPEPSHGTSELRHNANKFQSSSNPSEEKSDKDQLRSDGSNNKLYISKAVHPCLWFFHSFRLKCGNAMLVLRHRKIFWWSALFFFSCYILQKNREALRRIAADRARSIRSALLDMWQLAFSVQVNPLAAVQALPATTNASR